MNRDFIDAKENFRVLHKVKDINHILENIARTREHAIFIGQALTTARGMISSNIPLLYSEWGTSSVKSLYATFSVSKEHCSTEEEYKDIILCKGCKTTYTHLTPQRTYGESTTAHRKNALKEAKLLGYTEHDVEYRTREGDGGVDYNSYPDGGGTYTETHWEYYIPSDAQKELVLFPIK